MARLYHIKENPSDLYLIHPFNGNPRKISCEPVAQRLLSELDYQPGVLHNCEGEKIPTDLLWALWETDLIGTGEVGEQDPEIGKPPENDGEPIPLQEEDFEIIKRLIESYTGDSRRSLEEVAESLGLSLGADSTGNTLPEDGDGFSHDPNSNSSMDEERIFETSLEAGGVFDDLSATEFGEWYKETVANPQFENFPLSSETARALVFLKEQTEVVSVKLTGEGNSDEIQLVSDISPDELHIGDGNIESVRFLTGDYLLPSEHNLTGAWDDEFPFVDWEVQSSLSLAETNSKLDLSTMVTIHPSGISELHSGIGGGSGNLREEFAARRYQTKIAESVLQHHINSNGPFALSESRNYTEYNSSIEFEDDQYS